MNQEELRNKLICVVENGLVAKIIAQKTKIPPDVLSRFKNGKDYKEDLIKKIAEQEYKNGTIIKKCYEAMMSYNVEITD